MRRAVSAPPPLPDNPHGHDGHDHGHDDHGEAPWPIVVALTVTAAGTIALFFLPGTVLALANMLVGGGS